jgi:tRNA nucleotidyltransferase (CCA-adding enzyme)
MDKMETVLATVLDRVTPNAAERKKILALADRLERKVRSAAERSKVETIVRVEGSVAKDTWLSGEPDVDVFMRVSTRIPRAELGEVCLKVARAATRGSRQVERFADHPYLEAFVDNTRVNVVPCYDSKPMDWLSATDRTPYHTDFVNKRLDSVMRDEVRLLKKFMKGIGAYGAEIKTGGFSGYLCELLVLHFGSFLKVIEAFAGLKQKLVIDIEGFYEDKRRDLNLLFDEPLVVVDPVDRARNVASAVRPQRLYAFVAASQMFLKKPKLDFFYPTGTVPFSPRRIRSELKKRGSAIVFVTFGKIRVVPDILWGQLYKSQRSLRKLIKLNDFTVLRDLPWSDENSLNVFVFELENRCLSSTKLHLGPPLDKAVECERFVGKHLGREGTVCGPYVEGGRWVVLVKRKHIDACVLLRDKLKNGGKSAGVAEGLSHVVKRGFDVFVNEEVVKLYGKNELFAIFLTDFLVGKPHWLETA